MIGLALLALLLQPSPPAGGAPAALEPLGFLIGVWEAVGAGAPGQGTGTAAFTRELQERVIVRRSFAEYPATATSPASRHDDLMVVYADGGRVRADYYDSEGHVIRYGVTATGRGEAVFLGDPAPGAPRYRLTYRLAPTGALDGEFAIAAPGAPDTFTTYLRWTSRRRPDRPPS